MLPCSTIIIGFWFWAASWDRKLPGNSCIYLAEIKQAGFSLIIPDLPGKKNTSLPGGQKATVFLIYRELTPNPEWSLRLVGWSLRLVGWFVTVFFALIANFPKPHPRQESSLRHPQIITELDAVQPPKKQHNMSSKWVSASHHLPQVVILRWECNRSIWETTK